jgi:hypothetical protein
VRIVLQNCSKINSIPRGFYPWSTEYSRPVVRVALAGRPGLRATPVPMARLFQMKPPGNLPMCALPDRANAVFARGTWSRQDIGQVSVGSNFARGRRVLASLFWQILWPADTEYSSASLLYTSVSGQPRLSICFGSEASDRGNGTVRAALFDLPPTFVQWSDTVVRHAPDPEGIAH